MEIEERDRQAAELAIRRGQMLGDPIKPCSCMMEPPKFRNCYGTCKDAVDAVAAEIAKARREGMEEVSLAWFAEKKS